MNRPKQHSATQLKAESPPKNGYSDKGLSKEHKLKKRQLVRWAIVACLSLIPLLLWLQSRLYTNEEIYPISNNILIFGLINLNVLLVLFVLFLILRYLAELFFERQVQRPGSKLKTKLIASFVSLTLIPTILLFFVALQFVSTSMDYWFNSSIEQSLQESLELAQSFLHDATKEAELINSSIATSLKAANTSDASPEIIQQNLETLLEHNTINGPDSITLTNEDHSINIAVLSPKNKNLILPKVPLDLITKVKQLRSPNSIIQKTNQGELVRCVAEIEISSDGTQKAILVTSLLVEKERLESMELISQGIEGYRQLKHFKDPFKFWIFIILLIVTLLIVFAAIWFGLYISHGITDPLGKLVKATHRVAEGDLEFEMESESNDEIGLLINSFNQMTTNLNNSTKQLAETHAALKLSSNESEQRRRYTEIILQNVSAGVISLDDHNRITTINRFAEKLLNINKDFFLGKTFKEVLHKNQAAIIQGFVDELAITGKISVEQHLRINILGKNYSLLVHFTRLEDEENIPLGHVLVFDNLTKLEKMQRMAAWREVARRIAHEIKNPLTPIQLSAQRLRRRYPDILKEDDSVFDQCTNTIIGQVDELKRLVSEFSQFARMPEIQKDSGDLGQLAQETLILYKEAHKHIQFTATQTAPIPIFSFDEKQIKRCIINLLDNAVAVLPNGGKIEIELTPDSTKDNVFIRVSDNGPGISKENKLKLFEPYFSTKKTGTGLGLAIVSTIISDHNGYIRVHDNEPNGSVFTIELPLTEQQKTV